MNAATAAATGAFTVVYLTALMSKVRSRASLGAFSRGLTTFGITGGTAQRVVTVLVVSAEALVLVALALPVFGPGHRATPATVLTAVLTLATGRAGRGQSTFACHCFGSTTPTSIRSHLSINVGLITLGLVGIVLGPAALSSGGSLLAVGAGVIAGFVAVTFRPLIVELNRSVGTVGMRSS